MNPPSQPPDPAEAWIDDELRALGRRHLERGLRVLPEVGGVVRERGRRLLNLSSNDYLNLAHHPDLAAGARQALDQDGCGSTASRLVTGTLPIHEELEHALAARKGTPAALLFGSGYLANIGVLPAIAGPGDTVLADRLIHASLVDGILLSRARLCRFRHNDPDHLAALLKKTHGSGRTVVITESVFSMDGDLAPLETIAACCHDAGAMLVVDEAHAMGVFGPRGAGRVRELGLEQAVNISIGTLSKALGGYGGFVACSDRMRAWLINRGRPFVYSTALPPPTVGAALAALALLDREPERGARLLGAARRFRHRLQEEGLDTEPSASQVIPVRIGDNEEALRVARGLADTGILAIPMRPPTVPAGTARLRLAVTTAHTEEDLDLAARTIARAVTQSSP